MDVRLSGLLERWVPVDPDYAPFELRLLRGLGALPVAMVALVALFDSGQWFALRVAGGMPLTVAAGKALLGWLQTLVSYVPLLALPVMALNFGLRRFMQLAVLGAALLAGSFLQAGLYRVSFCVVGRVPWSDVSCRLFEAQWYVLSQMLASLPWGGAIALVLWFGRRERDTALAAHRSQRDRLEAQRQESEARLLMLQAQIEPHFLFNTLAHIQGLQQVDAARGRSMLSALLAYLRSALPQMRASESTLGRELALTCAYTSVQQIRMGDRLRVDIEVPDPLLDAPVPPMMLLTLAENAIKHGLGPKREGGTLRIGARVTDGRLALEVVDDGMGLRLGGGAGAGLANTRARLATQFGAAAALEIANNEHGPGVRAALRLPLSTAGAPR